MSCPRQCRIGRTPTRCPKSCTHTRASHGLDRWRGRRPVPADLSELAQRRPSDRRRRKHWRPRRKRWGWGWLDRASPEESRLGGIGLPDRKSTRLNSQSRQYLVCRLLLEKKKKKTRQQRRRENNVIQTSYVTQTHGV